MDAPAERVPAWRLSEIGLTPESSGTSTGHRGIFMANYAAWMLRLAHYTGDEFLARTADHAVIGRYRNFPGYHINTARTTVYEKADYPLRGHMELGANSFHYNHIMPHISLLYDFLVTQALFRSGGKVDFPGEFIEGYAYLQSKFYGHLPGTIYGTTKTKGTPHLPTKARVVLQHQRSKLPVRETWSDPTTGYFEFRGIDASQQFLTLAEDAAGNFRPVAANRLTPEVLP